MKKLIDGITFVNVVGYYITWWGGAFISLWAIKAHTDVFNTMFILLSFFAFARIQYLEDLLKQVEKRLNGEDV